jgi:AcrR family transcriptional regulator
MSYKCSCTTYNSGMATGGGSGTSRGAATRGRILDAAAGLLVGGRTVTVGEVAAAAGVYPNQITHHFGSKDRLVLDAAFTLFLRDTARLQAAGRRAPTATTFRAVIARSAFLMPSTPLVVAALARADDGEPALRERSAQFVALLFRQSERYLARVVAERGWVSTDGVARDARTFWSAVFGGVLLARSGAAGAPSDVDLAATISIVER